MLRLYASAAAVAITAVVAGTFAYTQLAEDDSCSASTLAGAEIGGPFTLVSETGETVTDADVIQQPTLIYFGFTFCPDVCPLDAARMAIVTDILQEEGRDVKPVFISIDPERDTPEVLANYTANLHPDMLGLTGSLEQVDAASKAYKTYYAKQDTGDEFYLVDHSTFTYLMLPEIGLADFYRRDLAPEEMAARVACHIDAA